MQNLTRKHEKENNQLHYEINKMKVQIQRLEKALIFMD